MLYATLGQDCRKRVSRLGFGDLMGGSDLRCGSLLGPGIFSSMRIILDCDLILLQGVLTSDRPSHNLLGL